MGVDVNNIGCLHGSGYDIKEMIDTEIVSLESGPFSGDDYAEAA
jgi:hypothetical protein